MSCAEQESYLIVHVYSRAVSMHMFSPAYSIVPPCGCRLQGLICVYWIELFAVRKCCVKVSFAVWGTERSVPCVCSYKIYHRVDQPIHEYQNHFVAARNVRALAALGDLTLVIPCCRTD